MFDDQITSSKEPEDIFEKIEPPSPAPYAPVERKPMLPLDADVSIKEPIISSRKVIVVLGVIVGILAVVGIVYGVLRFARSTASLPEQAQVSEPAAE